MSDLPPPRPHALMMLWAAERYDMHQAFWDSDRDENDYAADIGLSLWGTDFRMTEVARWLSALLDREGMLPIVPRTEHQRTLSARTWWDAEPRDLTAVAVAVERGWTDRQIALVALLGLSSVDVLRLPDDEVDGLETLAALRRTEPDGLALLRA